MGWSVYALTERQLGVTVAVSAPILTLTSDYEQVAITHGVWQGRGSGRMHSLAFEKVEGAMSSIHMPLARGEHMPPAVVASASMGYRRYDARCSVSDLDRVVS